MASVKSDYIETRRGEPVTFDVARNDDSIVNVTAIGSPSGGTLEKLSEPGTWFKFTPNPGYVGQEVISYTGVDAGAVSYISTVILAVRRPRSSEYIPDLVISCETDGATLQLADQVVVDEGGTPLPIVGLERPNHGTLVKTDEFELSYTPEAGFLGDDRCGYSVGDGDNLIHGQIKITVGVANTPPTISGWSESVSFNTAKIINVLAHASDAESDPLQTIVSTAPSHGVAVVLPDQTVRYTPTLGYSGSDSFGVKVFDGQDLSSEATVSITVGVASFPTFANGYRARRRIVIPARTADAGAPSEANYAVLIRETIASFRDTANGGKVASSLGHDFRVETEAGTKLDHELELYNPATGQIVLWFRIPTWAVHQQHRVLLYYGKPDISGDEANVSGCWSGYLAVINAKTGADKTGNGRTLTPAGTINDATLIGPAGQYAGSAVAATATVAWLTGLTGITVQSYSVHDAAMAGSSKGWLTQGPTDLVDANQGTVLQFLAAPSAGITNVVHFKVRVSDGNAFVFSANNAAAAGAMLVHGTWTQGAAPSIYLGGVLQVPASASAVRAGTTSMGTGSLYIGRGARDAAGGGYVGVLDDVRFSASARTALRIAAEAANMLTPEKFYGIGDEDLPADTSSTASPVALPIFDSVQSALEKDFAVAASAYVPGGSAPTISAIGTVANGDVSNLGSAIRYQPASFYVGDDGCTYTVSRSGKSSSSRLYIAVLGPGAERPGPPPPTFPKYPPAVANSKLRTVGYTGPSGSTAYAAGDAGLTAALAAAVPGDKVSLADGTYATNRTISCNGSLGGGYITIAARNHRGAITTGSWNCTGDYVWFTGLTAQRPGTDPDPNNNRPFETASFYSFVLRGKHNLVTNCQVDSSNGIWLDCDDGTRASDLTVTYNTLTGRTPPRWNVANCIYMGRYVTASRGTDNVLIARNRFADDLPMDSWGPEDAGDDDRNAIYCGNSKPGNNNSGNNRTVRITENFFDLPNIKRCCYQKRGYEFSYNFVRGKGNTSEAVTLRHGGYSMADGTVFAGLTDAKRALWIGNNIDRGKVTVNDTDHLFISNRIANQLTLRCGCVNAAGALDGQAASRLILVGNTVGSIELGSLSSNNHHLDLANGGKVAGVKNYAAGIAQPTPTRPEGDTTVVAGTGGYELLTGNGGYTTVPYVLRAALEPLCGCDPAA